MRDIRAVKTLTFATVVERARVTFCRATSQVSRTHKHTRIVSIALGSPARSNLTQVVPRSSTRAMTNRELRSNWRNVGEISASSSNYICNLRQVKAVRDRLRPSTRSHIRTGPTRRANKAEQTGLPTDLFINSREKLRAPIDFYCAQLRATEGISPFISLGGCIC